MKAKFKIISTASRRLIIFSSACILFFSIFILGGCKKEKSLPQGSIGNDTKTSKMRKINTGTYEAVDNPYKLENVLATIARYKTKQKQFTNYQLNPNQIDVFVKIKASDIPAEKAKSLRQDLDFFDYPMDAAMLYEPGLTDEKLNTLKNEYIYATIPKNSSLLLDAPFIKLYEIYKPTEAEKWLHVALLFDGDLLNDEDRDNILGKMAKMELPLEPGGGGGGGVGGGDDDDGCWFSWPKPAHPKGRIKYNDSRLGIVGVINVKVIAWRFFGSDVAWTDANGNFAMSGNFWIGAPIFTKFTNNNISIVPYDVSGGLSVINVINSFFVGSLSVPIIHNKSQLSNVDITYNNLDWQINFWSHIINMDYYHRQYCLQEGILPAPTQLLFRAKWENEPENGAGTLMIPNIAIGGANLQVMQMITDAYNTTQLGTIFTSAAAPIKNLLTMIAPDVSVSSGPTYLLNFTGNSNYSSDISKTILHELSHASMYSKVGGLYWINLGMQEIETDDGGNYGWGNITNNATSWLGGSNTDITKAQPSPLLALINSMNTLTYNNTCDNFIELSEAWAEFLGENFARRIYTGAAGSRMCSPLGGGANGNLNNFPPLAPGKTPYTLFTLSSKMESGHAWADVWIPCGMFHDLMDVTNSDAIENDWDQYGGYTISEMYNSFDISRPAHVDYLTFIAPIHGYNYGQLENLFIKNKGQ